MLNYGENCNLTHLNVHTVHIVIKYITFTVAASQIVSFGPVLEGQGRKMICSL